MGGVGVTAATRIYYALVLVCRGAAPTTLQTVAAPNGGEAWRALCRRSEPRTAPRMHSLMNAILGVIQLSNELSFFELQIGEREEQIRHWESQSGEVFNGGMERPIFLDKGSRQGAVIASAAETSTLTGSSSERHSTTPTTRPPTRQAT